MMSSEVGTSDIFSLKTRLEIPSNAKDSIEIHAKITSGGINYFAAALKCGDLLLVSDGVQQLKSFGAPTVGPAEKKWSLKHIPWFDDTGKKISALALDPDGILYIGTVDGHIYELNAAGIISGVTESGNDFKSIFHLHELRIVQLVVWHRDNMKMVFSNGDNCKLAMVHSNALPVLVTFLNNICNMEIYINNVGLSCLLVSLENSSNVFCVLDDLEIPTYEPHEAPGEKKSIFRKARDNIMSKLSDEKMNFFNRKSNKETTNSTSLPAVVRTTTTTIVSGKLFPISNVKFTPIEDVNCRGLLRRISGKNQFIRHINNKLDIFDGDFRQTATVFIPNHINKLFVIQRIFFGIDEEHKCIRISVVHNGTLKEFALVPSTSQILYIQPIDEDDPSIAPYSVFIICKDGIHEICLRKTPIETCLELLLKETNNVMLDVVCSALNVSKANVCVLAGDTRSEEGKFAKAILYYKIAGLNYTKILAKFGSCGHITALLCFYELMDQEQKTKLSGNAQDRQMMGNLAITARVEQFLRHGKSIGDIARSPKNLLKNMLNRNPHYSAKHAASILSHVQLLWALKMLGIARMCYPAILHALHDKPQDVDDFVQKNSFWEILTADWLALYTLPPSVFDWFRQVVLNNVKDIELRHVQSLITVLIPWRRELQEKFFGSHSSNTTEIIDFTVTNDAGRVPLDGYVNLFVTLVLELIQRNSPRKFILPNFLDVPKVSSHTEHDEVTQSDHNDAKKPHPATLQPLLKTFSCSNNHCACVRNGKLYVWGQNMYGRLGIVDDRRVNIESPTVVNIAPSLRISIKSVSCGINHTLALTTCGTIFVFGSNAYGQLGLGSQTMWTDTPTPLTILPDIIVTQVAAGGYHAVAIDHLHRVWTWGHNIHGQLGNGSIENAYKPQLIEFPEKIVSASAGHSHTAFLSETGHVYTCGCSHFGQVGQGLQQKKVKVPTMMSQFAPGITFWSVECGLTSTAMISTNNRLYYAGLNPATLRTLLSGHKRREQRNNAIAAGICQSEIVFEEEKDFSSPVIIDTSHLAGEITKVNVATTHMAVLTNQSLVYTWGLGKSGQLVRPDDDSRTLELIDTEDKVFVASDICCGGDCTFVIEKDTHRCYGCGFNSVGQLGKLQTEEESAVMTIKTKKRVVKVRQPSNIYFRLREILGLPKPLKESTQPSASNAIVAPKSPPVVNQELLEWILRLFKRHYDPKVITDISLQYENYAAASLLETMAENHEFALKHSLSLHSGNKGLSASLIGNYLNNADKKNAASVHQCSTFLRVVISHWSEHSLSSADLEEILEPFRTQAPWNAYLNCAVKEIISSSDDSAKWIAANMSPVFILKTIKDSKNGTFLVSPTIKPPGDGVSAVTSTYVEQSSSANSSSEPLVIQPLEENVTSNGYDHIINVVDPGDVHLSENKDKLEESSNTKIPIDSGAAEL